MRRFDSTTGWMSAALCSAMALGAAGCSDENTDPNAQIGPNPKLPEINQYLFPPMHLASVVGWKNNEKPAVAQGLQIEALANLPGPQ